MGCGQRRRRVAMPPDLRCERCGEADQAQLVAFAPGDAGVHPDDLFTVLRPQRGRAWCMGCWREQFAVAAEGAG